MDQQQNNISVLIPDGESHLTLYVINCLIAVEEVDLYILSNVKLSSVRFSKGIKKFIYKENSTDHEWIDAIKSIVTTYNIEIIFPVFEKRIKTILENKDEFDTLCKIVNLPELDIFNTAIDKWLLSKHCNQHGILIPKTYSQHEASELCNNDGFYPVIAKPLSGYGGGHGIEILENVDQFNEYSKNYTLKSSFIVQDYIKGYDIDCSVLCKDGNILAYTIQKGYMPNKTLFKPQIGLEFTHNDSIVNTVSHLMQTLNWSGIAHIDGRFDTSKDQFNIIEINPRIWVSLDASLLAGVNFPLLLLQSSLNHEIKKCDYLNMNYLSIKGVLKTIISTKRGILSSKFLKNNTQFKFVFQDPKPFIYKFINRTKNLILNKKPVFD